MVRGVEGFHELHAQLREDKEKLPGEWDANSDNRLEQLTSKLPSPEQITNSELVKEFRVTLDRFYSNLKAMAEEKKEEEARRHAPTTSGKNAYEIRADVLDMAIRWSMREDNALTTDDQLLTLAKKFYAFVENKR